ncbi:hypothetical protein [Sphingobacterium sp. DR205]|uniref:hypothetical protein n=1 Tax=Sphingobacterium sp. DR205 TaxID=2713573 RepID=UPI0013E49715|nr:hypothetical protein [Sphingobacterium sp. DR205]QIH35576.1 hypothetical protein G6053_23070 [Sphingobacterium sp. DR205]
MSLAKVPIGDDGLYVTAKFRLVIISIDNKAFEPSRNLFFYLWVMWQRWLRQVGDMFHIPRIR